MKFTLRLFGILGLVFVSFFLWPVVIGLALFNLGMEYSVRGDTLEALGLFFIGVLILIGGILYMINAFALFGAM